MIYLTSCILTQTWDLLKFSFVYNSTQSCLHLTLFPFYFHHIRTMEEYDEAQGVISEKPLNFFHESFQKLKNVMSSIVNDAEDAAMAEMLTMMSDLINTKKEFAQELRISCKELIANIEEAQGLLQLELHSSSQISTSLPLQVQHDKLQAIYNEYKEDISRRKSEINKYKQSISVASSELQLEQPVLSNLLTDEALEEHKNYAQRLEKQRAETRARFNEIINEIKMMEDFLGKTGMKRPKDMSNDAYRDLECWRDEIQKEYRCQKNKFDNVNGLINSALSILELPEDYPFSSKLSNDCAPGSDNNLEQLQLRLEELQILKRERLGIILGNTCQKIRDMYDALYYDQEKRIELSTYDHSCSNINSNIDSNDANEERLNFLEAELYRLQTEVANDPDRTVIVDILQRYEKVFENEKELQKMGQDSMRLARGGFVAAINREARLKKYNEKCTNEVMTKLLPLVKKYSEVHQESFTFHGMPITKLIQSKKASIPRRASITSNSAPNNNSMSRKRKVPQGHNTSINGNTATTNNNHSANNSDGSHSVSPMSSNIAKKRSQSQNKQTQIPPGTRGRTNLTPAGVPTSQSNRIPTSRSSSINTNHRAIPQRSQASNARLQARQPIIPRNVSHTSAPMRGSTRNASTRNATSMSSKPTKLNLDVQNLNTNAKLNEVDNPDRAHHDNQALFFDANGELPRQSSIRKNRTGANEFNTTINSSQNSFAVSPGTVLTTKPTNIPTPQPETADNKLTDQIANSLPEWGRKRQQELIDMDMSYFDTMSFEYSRDAF